MSKTPDFNRHDTIKQENREEQSAMSQVEDSRQEDTAMKHIIQLSLTSSQPYFLLTAFPTETLESVHHQIVTFLQELRSKKQGNVVRNIIVTRFSLPWSEHPALTFYHRCLERMSLEELSDYLRAARYDGGYKSSESTLIGDVLKCITSPHANRDNSVWAGNRVALLQSYLTDSCSQVELRRLALARNLTTEERYLLLQCIWECLQGVSKDQAVQEHTRLWLCVDALENILDYSPKERRDLVRGLEYLISSTGTFLTTWLNIAESDPQVVMQVKAAFGTKLWNWLDNDLTDAVEGEGP